MMTWPQSFVLVLGNSRGDSTDEVEATELQSTTHALQKLLSVLLSYVK